MAILTQINMSLKDASHSTLNSVSDKNSKKKASNASTAPPTINRGVTISKVENFIVLSLGFIPNKGSIFPYSRGTKYIVGNKANKIPENKTSFKNATTSKIGRAHV